MREEKEGYGGFQGKHIISTVSGDGGKGSLSSCSRGISHTIKGGRVIYRKRRHHSKREIERLI
jgi:hypothetical protein